MNRTLTATLVVVFVSLVIVVVTMSSDDEKSLLLPPFLYDVEISEITSAVITYDDELVEYQSINGDWSFSSTGEPVDAERWAGIPQLLQGPRIVTSIGDEFGDLVDYGLDDPSIQVAVTLQDGSVVVTLIGSVTPDGLNHYASLEGSSRVVLLERGWGDIMAGLVANLPG